MSKKLNQMIREELGRLRYYPDPVGEKVLDLTNPLRIAIGKRVNKAGDVYDKYGVAGTLKRGGEEVVDVAKQSLNRIPQMMGLEEMQEMIRAEVKAMLNETGWPDVQHAVEKGVERIPGGISGLEGVTKAVMTADEHDPTGLANKAFKAGQLIGQKGPAAFQDAGPATMHAVGKGLEAAGRQADIVGDYWKKGLPAGLTRGGQEMVAAADEMNESQDSLKRLCEVALKPYGTCKYED